MKYRKRPVIIEAFQWTGDQEQLEDTEWIIEAIKEDKVHFQEEVFPNRESYTHMLIETLEGTMIATHGDYIIKGIKGEIYPCKSDIFEATYEPVIEKDTVEIGFYDGDNEVIETEE